GRLDDFGPDRIERLLLIVVAAAGDREARAHRRHHPEFRHFLLPISLFGFAWACEDSRPFLFYATRRDLCTISGCSGPHGFRSSTEQSRNQAVKVSHYRKGNQSIRLHRAYSRRLPVKLTNLKITPKLGILVGMTLLGLCAAGVLAALLMQREMLNARIDQTRAIV